MIVVLEQLETISTASVLNVTQKEISVFHFVYLSVEVVFRLPVQHWPALKVARTR